MNYSQHPRGVRRTLIFVCVAAAVLSALGAWGVASAATVSAQTTETATVDTTMSGAGMTMEQPTEEAMPETTDGTTPTQMEEQITEETMPETPEDGAEERMEQEMESEAPGELTPMPMATGTVDTTPEQMDEQAPIEQVPTETATVTTTTPMEMAPTETTTTTTTPMVMAPTETATTTTAPMEIAPTETATANTTPMEVAPTATITIPTTPVTPAVMETETVELTAEDLTPPPEWEVFNWNGADVTLAFAELVWSYATPDRFGGAARTTIATPDRPFILAGILATNNTPDDLSILVPEIGYSIVAPSHVAVDSVFVTGYLAEGTNYIDQDRGGLTSESLAPGESFTYVVQFDVPVEAERLQIRFISNQGPPPTWEISRTPPANAPTWEDHRQAELDNQVWQVDRAPQLSELSVGSAFEHGNIRVTATEAEFRASVRHTDLWGNESYAGLNLEGDFAQHSVAVTVEVAVVGLPSSQVLQFKPGEQFALWDSDGNIYLPENFDAAYVAGGGSLEMLLVFATRLDAEGMQLLWNPEPATPHARALPAWSLPKPENGVELITSDPAPLVPGTTAELDGLRATLSNVRFVDSYTGNLQQSSGDIPFASYRLNGTSIGQLSSAPQREVVVEAGNGNVLIVADLEFTNTSQIVKYHTLPGIVLMREGSYERVRGYIWFGGESERLYSGLYTRLEVGETVAGTIIFGATTISGDQSDLPLYDPVSTDDRLVLGLSSETIPPYASECPCPGQFRLPTFGGNTVAHWWITPPADESDSDLDNTPLTPPTIETATGQ